MILTKRINVIYFLVFLFASCSVQNKTVSVEQPSLRGSDFENNESNFENEVDLQPDPVTSAPQCVLPEDCVMSNCIDGTCQRALLVTGVVEGINGQYFDQGIVRIDFNSQPTVKDFDGSPVELPVDPMGRFQTRVITNQAKSNILKVGGVELMGTNGSLRYQTIEKDQYYGVIISAADALKASGIYDDLQQLAILGEELEMVLYDTSEGDSGLFQEQ